MNSFYWNIFKEVVTDSEPGSNVCISARNIYQALAMIHVSALGDTSSQLTKILQKDFSSILYKKNKELLKSEAALFVHLQQLCEQSSGLFCRETLQKEYSDIVSNMYKSDHKKLDFNDVSKACKVINNWVDLKTKKMISNIVDESCINTDTSLVLVAAIYFKSVWDKPFDREDTDSRDFKLNHSKNVKIKMMYKSIEARVYEDKTEGFTALIDKFNDNATLFICILPDSFDGVKKLAQKLTDTTIKKIVQKSVGETVNLYLPKFSLECFVSLKNILQKMGVTNLFDSKKCQIRPSSGEGTYVSTLCHKSKVSIDEEGVEAAAVTNMMCSDAITDDRDFCVDRPFVFLIYDPEYQIPLFTSVVMNPNA